MQNDSLTNNEDTIKCHDQLMNANQKTTAQVERAIIVKLSPSFKAWEFIVDHIFQLLIHVSCSKHVIKVSAFRQLSI